MKITRETLPGAIKVFCWTRGITYKQFGRAISTPQRTVENWAEGHRFPSGENLLKIIRLMQKG